MCSVDSFEMLFSGFILNSFENPASSGCCGNLMAQWINLSLNQHLNN